jgi:Ser/Thr protein kinase RdoA (MazF antagonist)
MLERVDGPTMWQQLQAEPDSAAHLGRTLSELQRRVFELTPSFDLPRQCDRLQVKLRLAGRAFGLRLEPLTEFVRSAEARTRDLGICHGDLHPHNVVMTPSRGPVLVDWFDAGAGVLAADIARTSILLQSVSGDPLRRAGPELAPVLASLCAAYLDAACDSAGLDPDDLDRWVTVQLAARLAEGLGDGCVAEVESRLARFGYAG